MLIHLILATALFSSPFGSWLFIIVPILDYYSHFHRSERLSDFSKVTQWVRRIASVPDWKLGPEPPTLSPWTMCTNWVSVLCWALSKCFPLGLMFIPPKSYPLHRWRNLDSVSLSDPVSGLARIQPQLCLDLESHVPNRVPSELTEYFQDQYRL